jgi:hypothetical protein
VINLKYKDMKTFNQKDLSHSKAHKHQIPDHHITFMKMIKWMVTAMSVENDESRQVINPCVICDGIID